MIGRVLRWTAWTAAVFLGALAVFFAQRWFAWQREPRAYGGTANALWARHQWVGVPRSRPR